MFSSSDAHTLLRAEGDVGKKKRQERVVFPSANAFVRVGERGNCAPRVCVCVRVFRLRVNRESQLILYFFRDSQSFMELFYDYYLLFMLQDHSHTDIRLSSLKNFFMCQARLVGRAGENFN